MITKSLIADELLCRKAPQKIKIYIEIAAPEPAHATPDLTGEARTVDAVHDARDGAPGKRMLCAVDVDETTDVVAHRILVLTRLL